MNLGYEYIPGSEWREFLQEQERLLDVRNARKKVQSSLPFRMLTCLHSTLRERAWGEKVLSYVINGESFASFEAFCEDVGRVLAPVRNGRKPGRLQ